MAGQKKLYAVFSFPTTTDAIHMESAARAAALPGRMIPVPEEITAGCGLSWMAPPESREALSGLAVREKIRVEGIYELEI
jgi:hypothetical protein